MRVICINLYTDEEASIKVISLLARPPSAQPPRVAPIRAIMYAYVSLPIPHQHRHPLPNPWEAPIRMVWYGIIYQCSYL